MEENNKDVNPIFRVAQSIFRAKTAEMEEIQAENLLKLISDAIESNNSALVGEAVDVCRNGNGKYEKEFVAITSLFSNFISSININDSNTNIHSDMLLIPIVAVANKGNVKIPAIKDIEAFYDAHLKKFDLIPSGSNFYLSHSILRSERANDLSLADWYRAHKTTVNKRDLIIKEKTYNESVRIASKTGSPELVYLIGVIVQNKKLLDLAEPAILSDYPMDDDDYEKFSKEVAEFFKEKSSTTDYEVLMPKMVFAAISNGDLRFQIFKITDFVNKNSKDEGVNYFVADYSDGLYVFACNKAGSVVDKMDLIDYLGDNNTENLSAVVESVAENKALIYLGGETVDEKFFNQSKDFNLVVYAQQNNLEAVRPMYDDE